jgi:N-methylhydantoinase A
LDKEGISSTDQIIEKYLDMRYVRQNFELEVPIKGSIDTLNQLEEIVTNFHSIHERTYGHSDSNAIVEIVNVKARGFGLIPKPRPAYLSSGNGDLTGALVGRRPVFFKQTNGWLDCPHYDRVKLFQGDEIQGPAMICQFDSSVVVLPGKKVLVGSLGELLIRAEKEFNND